MSERLSTREVAEMLGISIRSAQVYAQQGKLSATKDDKGRNRFNRREVERLRDSLRLAEVLAQPTAPNLKTYDPETHILIDRKDHSEHTQRYEGLLIKLGQMEAEVRLVRKQLEDMRAKDIPEKHSFPDAPIEATRPVKAVHADQPPPIDSVQPSPPPTTSAAKAVPEPSLNQNGHDRMVDPTHETPQPLPQHPAHGSQEGTQRLQDDWRKFVHGPAQIGPVDDPRPFWTAPVQKQEKPWWKRIFKK